jgi:hypothetical protein
VKSDDEHRRKDGRRSRAHGAGAAALHLSPRVGLS